MGEVASMENFDRILVCGDIHGEWDKFMMTYKKAAFNQDKDLLVFLGDYLDRGEPCL